MFIFKSIWFIIFILVRCIRLTIHLAAKYASLDHQCLLDILSYRRKPRKLSTTNGSCQAMLALSIQMVPSESLIDAKTFSRQLLVSTSLPRNLKIYLCNLSGSTRSGFMASLFKHTSFFLVSSIQKNWSNGASITMS